MWLLRDERKLLRYFYSKADGSGVFDIDSSRLESALCMNEKQVRNVLKSVRKLGLVTRCHKNQNTGVMEMDLTQEAINLGRKYTSWWLRSNLWYGEYIKNHWIWVIVSFLGGVSATLFVQWLSKTFM